MTEQSMLELYLAQVSDPDLRAKLLAEFEKSTKQFGLVFERHQPEGIQMPKVPVKAGTKVIRETDGTFHRVTAINGDTATIVESDGTTIDYPVSGLAVAREFGDVMYPGLEPVSVTMNGSDTDPVHTVINGENYHALEMLQYTHAGKVDLIYIDPPYNTGNKTWRYNDRYVGDKDSYKHSKWLSFMEKRLQLAHKLLSKTGVVIVAIGDQEHHRLRMLLDDIYGEENFISDVVWQGGRKNDSRYVSNGADYMLIYAKSEEALSAKDTRWREKKTGIDDALAMAEVIWSRHNGDVKAANSEWKIWLKKQKSSGASTDSVNRFDLLQAPDGRPVNTYGNITWPGGGGPDYDILHPVTGQICKPPRGGWRYSQERMLQEIDRGRIWFGLDESTIPRGITYLDEMEDQVALSVFTQDRKPANTYLRKNLGDLRFPNPKDHTVLMKWIRLTAPADAIILDFFGGSGTTAEAVMRLNAEDGGTRQAILVTNNELAAKDDTKLRKAGYGPGDEEYEALGVFRHVTKPRIETVVTGRREDGSTYSEGLAANVAFFDLNYLDAARVRTGLEFDSLAGVFWLRAGAVGPLIERETLRQGYAVSEDAKLAVLFKPGKAAALAELLASKPHPNLTHLFIVTESNQQGDEARAYFASHLIVERIYGSYLSAFQVNKKG